MRVIGFDPGLSVTGFGVLEKYRSQVRAICYGTIRPPKNVALPERLKHLYSEATKLIKTYNPDVIAIEDTFYQKNVKSAMKLGQARGALLLAGANADLSCMEYAPRKVKQSVVGNGAATKEQVQFMVQKILELKELPTPTDASDALAIGLCHLNQLIGINL